MKASLFFRWYDLWVGAYWDQKNRDLYVCLLPMFGLKLSFGKVTATKTDDLTCPYDGGRMKRVAPAWSIWACLSCATQWDDMASRGPPGSRIIGPKAPAGIGTCVYFDDRPKEWKE